MRSLPLASLALLVLAVAGCPKEETSTATTPVPSPAATASPGASPDGSPVPIATTSEAKPADAWTVRYTWSGGLSIYHHYELAISGTDSAKVVFKVKPMKQDEVVVEDTLTPDQFAELKGLFAAVNFDEVGTEPRKVRIMDIGQTTIAREVEGKKHEVTENPTTKASTDIRPLRQWLDDKVRLYLDKAGVAPRKKAPAASPTATPK